jgi:MraZ protein
LGGLAEGIIFSGHGICAADGKGRFALPLEMRKAVRQSSGDSNKICLSLHPQHDCAIGFGLSHKDWLEGQVLADQQAARGRGETFDDEAAREKYFPDLEDLNFDDGGRFFMPDDIKGMMGIGETALFVGTGRHIQIWAPEKYLEYKGRSRRVIYAVEQFLAGKGASK